VVPNSSTGLILRVENELSVSFFRYQTDKDPGTFVNDGTLTSGHNIDKAHAMKGSDGALEHHSKGQADGLSDHRTINFSIRRFNEDTTQYRQHHVSYQVKVGESQGQRDGGGINNRKGTGKSDRPCWR
jgi:hypothetical protein